MQPQSRSSSTMTQWPKDDLRRRPRYRDGVDADRSGSKPKQSEHMFEDIGVVDSTCRDIIIEVLTSSQVLRYWITCAIRIFMHSATSIGTFIHFIIQTLTRNCIWHMAHNCLDNIAAHSLSTRDHPGGLQTPEPAGCDNVFIWPWPILKITRNLIVKIWKTESRCISPYVRVNADLYLLIFK